MGSFVLVLKGGVPWFTPDENGRSKNSTLFRAHITAKNEKQKTKQNKQTNNTNKKQTNKNKSPHASDMKFIGRRSWSLSF